MASPEVNHLTPLSVSLILSIMENDATLTKIVILLKKNGTVVFHNAILFYFMTEIKPSRVLA